MTCGWEIASSVKEDIHVVILICSDTVTVVKTGSQAIGHIPQRLASNDTVLAPMFKDGQLRRINSWITRPCRKACTRKCLEDGEEIHVHVYLYYIEWAYQERSQLCHECDVTTRCICKLGYKCDVNLCLNLYMVGLDRFWFANDIHEGPLLAGVSSGFFATPAQYEYKFIVTCNMC